MRIHRIAFFTVTVVICHVADARFLQVDPIGYKDDMNVYSYVGNDAINAVDPTGEACIWANGLSDYCRRAYLYGRLDQKFSNQTRFFAAASATVEMLANTVFPGAVSSNARSFLNNLSGNLEKENIQMARELESGSLSGQNLDSRIVHREQTKVQEALNQLNGANPDGYRALVAEVNKTLNPSGVVAWAATQNPTDRVYGSILDSVRTDLGRDIDFANQSDREKIGNAVINYVRRTGGCDVTGSHIKRC